MQILVADTKLHLDTLPIKPTQNHSLQEASSSLHQKLKFYILIKILLIPQNK